LNIRPVATKLFHAGERIDRQTDIHTESWTDIIDEDNSRFLQFREILTN